MQPEIINVVNASLLYQYRVWNYSLMGPWFFLAATFGACAALYSKEIHLKYAAILLLCMQGITAGIGGAFMKWKMLGNAPIPIYFEIPAFPFFPCLQLTGGIRF